MSWARRHGKISRWWVPCGVGVCGLIAVLLFWFSAGKSFPQLMTEAERAWQRNDSTRTLSWAEQALAQQPDDPRAHLLAGMASQQLGQPDRALHFLEAIPDHAADAIAARLACGDLYLHQLQQPSAARDHYQRVLQLDSQNVPATQQLAYLLGLAGRSAAAEPHRLNLIRWQQVEPVLLYLLCAHDTLLENVEDLATYHAAAPTDRLLTPGVARKALEDGQTQRAEQLLRSSIAAAPEDTAAQIVLGRILATDDRRFSDWYETLPESVRQSEDVWSLLGTWAVDHGQAPAAARCFWEALRINPNAARANYQLGRWLASQGQPDEAAIFLQRAELLEHYFSLVTQAWTGSHPDAVEQAADTAEKLGLLWEAYAWALLMSKHAPDAEWPSQLLTRLEPQMASLPLLRTPPQFNPATRLDLSLSPLPKFSDRAESVPSIARPSSAESPDTTIRFANQALELGLEFRYFNGAPRDQQTRRMYEFNGGGVAVLDYDADGWPDVLLTQGAEWPPGSGSNTFSDRLFRNVAASRFVDVTASAQVVDQQFSAGVAVGDLDNDGFPDLYIANIGGNQMWMNNGDGTFRDVTASTNTAGNDWSTSCAIADMNGDQLPDVYVVNYLSGADVFERLCRDEQDHVRSCSPRDFAAAQDRLYLNQGDGSFQDATESSGILVPEGKGLGIAVGDFSGTGQLDIFIANDAVPNFYFVKDEKSTASAPHMEEQALLRGLAFNAAGRAEACMGIAVGDADGDARLDLFVTNFHNETNTLYQQTASGDFQDATRVAQLDQPSLKMLGFGTQFLDPDLDGDLDLIVANGHIDDLSDTGIPYEMRAQFFRNDGRGHFTELPEKSVGPYFGIPQLGRAVAVLDWNRDGREDVAISHLDTPAALLTNQSLGMGNSLRLNLRGTESSRDAIGSIVTVEVQGRTLTRQLTAGDGFQACNQRHLVMGIGTATAIDRLTVRWPNGATLMTESVPINVDCLLIEGRDEVIPLP